MKPFDPFIYLCLLSIVLSLGISYLVLSFFTEGIKSIKVMVKDSEEQDAKKTKSPTGTKP